MLNYLKSNKEKNPFNVLLDNKNDLIKIGGLTMIGNLFSGLESKQRYLFVENETINRINDLLLYDDVKVKESSASCLGTLVKGK